LNNLATEKRDRIAYVEIRVEYGPTQPQDPATP
jgi:hypothetical protein